MGKLHRLLRMAQNLAGLMLGCRTVHPVKLSSAPSPVAERRPLRLCHVPVELANLAFPPFGIPQNHPDDVIEGTECLSTRIRSVVLYRQWQGPRQQTQHSHGHAQSEHVFLTETASECPGLTVLSAHWGGGEGSRQ